MPHNKARILLSFFKYVFESKDLNLGLLIPEKYSSVGLNEVKCLLAL